jgi:hypothetical protein
MWLERGEDGEKAVTMRLALVLKEVRRKKRVGCSSSRGARELART